MPGEISITSYMHIVPPQWQKAKRNSLLMKVKGESERAAFKLNIQKTKIMTYGPIISWQIDGETTETVPIYFLGLQNHWRWWCSHEIKRCLLLRRKAITNQDSILKSRDITLPTKVCVVKAMVFPVVMYGCECWTIKKDWCWSSSTLATWCEELTRWKRPGCWEGLRAGGKGCDRGWGG